MIITLQFQDTAIDAAALLTFAERFTSKFAKPAPAVMPMPPAPKPQPAMPQESSVAKWFARLGQGSRSFWILAAQFSKQHERWTFEELGDTQRRQAELRSYHRNSYRAIKAESATDPLVKEWDAARGCYVYFLAPEIRDEILRLAGQQ